ncbi:MAG: pyrroloquinoline quinone biosynthesis protein PqqB, partial [Planctomycetes bacterium]|nr:pyrroloquinoline quinone biosynthesis protein PqqB [Planctomycetota bacterium]
CSALYLPDIDTWDRWDTPLGEALRGVDVAFLDGTFFDAGELPGRAPAEVPHPPIRDTLRRLASLPAAERAKVRFLHLNHTNPALDPGSDAARLVREAGCAIAREGETVEL